MRDINRENDIVAMAVEWLSIDEEIVLEGNSVVSKEVCGEWKVCSSCWVNDALPLHVCPYRADIYNDKIYQCDCCADCMAECAADI